MGRRALSAWRAVRVRVRVRVRLGLGLGLGLMLGLGLGLELRLGSRLDVVRRQVDGLKPGAPSKHRHIAQAVLWQREHAQPAEEPW